MGLCGVSDAKGRTRYKAMVAGEELVGRVVTNRTARQAGHALAVSDASSSCSQDHLEVSRRCLRLIVDVALAVVLLRFCWAGGARAVVAISCGEGYDATAIGEKISNAGASLCNPTQYALCLWILQLCLYV